jgi:hypothetical protein
MRKLTAFLSILLFCLTISGLAQPQQLSTPFDHITSVNAIGQEQLLITQSKGEYKAKLFDIAKDSVIHRFIHAGLGFGQAESIRAADYHQQSKQFIFYTKFQRLIKTDSTGKVIAQTQTNIPNVNHICSASDKTVQAFAFVAPNKSEIKNNSPITVSYTIDLETMETVDSLRATPKELALDEINAHATLQMDFLGHKLDKKRTLLTYQGSKYLFLFENKELIKKVPANIPGNWGIKAEERGGNVGYIVAGVFTYLQKVDNETLLFSMGNGHQDLSYGAIYVSVSDDNNIMVSHEKLYNTFDDVASNYNHIFTGSHRIWFSGFIPHSNVLYKETLDN